LVLFFVFICQKNSASLGSDKNNGYFTWRSIYILDHISLNSF